jgi:pimeloyl-ACP methyl ester carboxylesterase
MTMKIHEAGEFQFYDEGEGPVIVLLHGLFGALSNWREVVEKFSVNYRILIPMLPIYEGSDRKADLEGLVGYLEKYVDFIKIEDFTLMGNSLGGHLGLIYTLRHPDKVKNLVLTGSSGLFENSMGGSFPRRGSYEYISERVGYTFYDSGTATKELIDEVFDTTRSIPKCLRIVSIAKSAQRHNMAKDLHKITAPTLLIWGLTIQLRHRWLRMNLTDSFLVPPCDLLINVAMHL